MNFMGEWLSFFTYQMLRMAVVVYTHPRPFPYKGRVTLRVWHLWLIE